jgi:pimeloyl-ACP methyl ester carboxylesterase
MIHRNLFIILTMLPLTTLGTHASEGVILLHGLCRTPGSMEKMAKGLSERGFAVVNQGYPSREKSIAELSESAISDALEDPRLAECEKIHFVTHSMGGILVRSYLKRHQLEKLGRVVMLAPPNQGSEVVDKIGYWRIFKALNGPAGNELGTGENSVPILLGKVDFELGVIAGDRSINWINSSFMINGPDDGKVSVIGTEVEGMKEQAVVHSTHPMIMKKKQVIELTAGFLKNGSFVGEGK